MKLIADTHTHTVASTHAYGTVSEIMSIAGEKGLYAVAITDHGPKLPDSPHIWHFDNMGVLPREVGGVKLLRGVEANIVSFDGDIDIPEYTLKMLDWVNASFHEPVLAPGTDDDHTRAWLGLIDNPYVDVLAHSGDERFTYHVDTVIKKAAQANKLIEINNSSFKIRKGSDCNCRIIAKKCIEHGAKVIVSSDAHCPWQVGKFDTVIEMFEELNMPEELVVNSSVERFLAYANARPGRKKI